MTDSPPERLYRLLPRVYRRRDAAQGQPLRALMAVLEEEYLSLQEDIAAMYDNWFVETCDSWVLPYLADLLGIEDLAQSPMLVETQRRRIANTIGYRRRKGLPSVLEQVLSDVTGWKVRAVEFYRHVAATQHLAHVRPASGQTVDLRHDLALAHRDGPFNSLAHTVEIEGSDLRPSSKRRQGKYNLQNLGLFVWRLRAYPVQESHARHIPHPDVAGCFTFDVLGRDVPLFNQPQPVDLITERAAAQYLPVELTRAMLHADLVAHAARIEGIAEHERPLDSVFFGPDRSLSICVKDRDGERQIRPEEVVSMNLGDWTNARERLPAHALRGTPKRVAVDVQLGRFVLLGAESVKTTGEVLVSYSYGFGDDMGGGTYTRVYEFSHLPQDAWEMEISEQGEINTLQQAFDAWHTYCRQCIAEGRQPVGVIKILDSGLYGGNNLLLVLPRGAQLTIMAADGVRPMIRPRMPRPLWTIATKFLPEEATAGALPVREMDFGDRPPSDRRLELNGLYVDGLIRIDDEAIDGTLDLEVRHCTLMPYGLADNLAAAEKHAFNLNIAYSIVGPLRLSQAVATLTVQDSILDSAASDHAVAGPGSGQSPGPPTTLERVTVLGAAHVDQLPLASDVIFAGPLMLENARASRIRFSYVPSQALVDGSMPAGDPAAAQQDHCQPGLALAQAHQSMPAGQASLPAALRQRILTQVRPVFTSTRFGDPGYGQLGPFCPDEIRTGGSDGAEMGAFHHLHQMQREINLHEVLDEYLPLGLDASIHYVT